MFNRYYTQELNNIRELASEFSKAHPSIAPMLEGTSQDPDVERLLEGMAFISGMLRQKLDDEFPEITQALMELTYPQYLRPLPSATLFSFTPKVNLMEKIHVEKGAKIDSVKIDDNSCLFSICYETEVFPASIESVEFENITGVKKNIKIRINLSNTNINKLNISRLRLFLNGPYEEASDLLNIIFTKTINFELIPDSTGKKAVFDKSKIDHGGFKDSESLIPYPKHASSGYRVIQEYFILPEKFLFLDIKGFDEWKDRGEGNYFEIVFNLKPENYSVPNLNKNSFQLFITPGINIFDHDSSPILLDHKQSEYRINPSGFKNNHYEIYSIKEVSGFIQGSVSKKEYSSLVEKKSKNSAKYGLKKRISPVTNEMEVFISIGYNFENDPPKKETLSINLLCTNGYLPGLLQTGDIATETSTSPELCTFRNIIPPTQQLKPPLNDNLWKYLSHLSLNILSLLNTENLKEVLSLYIFPEGRNQKNVEKLKKKIDGILDVKNEKSRVLHKGSVINGFKIKILMNSANFASKGDLYIFGAVLNDFFSTYSAINSFTHLIINDDLTGEEFQWKPRLGKEILV